MNTANSLFLYRVYRYKFAGTICETAPRGVARSTAFRQMHPLGGDGSRVILPLPFPSLRIGALWPEKQSLGREIFW